MRVRSWHFLISGALGGLLGFAVLELFQGSPPDGARWAGQVWAAALYFSGFGLAVGAALGATEGLVRRERFRAVYGLLMGLLLGGLGGMVGGALGQIVYGLVPVRTQVESTSDLALVLDSSGSMSGLVFGGSDPWGKRKKAAKELIRRLTPTDRVCVVDFDHEARIWLPLTTLQDEAAKGLALQAVGHIDSSGGTNLSAGLDAALTELGAHRTPGRPQVVIFLTDGAGDYDPASLAQAQALGITVYTVGLGPDVQTDLLQQIADGTGGKYFPVAKARDLTALFGQILTEHRSVTQGTAPAEAAALPDPRSRKLLFFLRIAGWGVIGLILGLGQGIRENTREDLFACSLGGLLGGLLGGALFDPVASLFAAGDGSLSRAVADVVVGAAIGGSMRLLQQKVVDDSGREPTPLTDILPTNSRLLRMSGPATGPGGHGRPTPAAPRVRPPEPVRPKAAPAPHQAEPPVPKEASLPRRPSPAFTEAAKPSLADFEARYPDRDEAMARARREGGYSLSEIGKHFGVPASTVRRAIDH